MSINIWVEETISRNGNLVLDEDNDKDFMDKHESLIILAVAGDKEAAKKLYYRALEDGYDLDDYDTTGADVTEVKVEENQQ